MPEETNNNKTPNQPDPKLIWAPPIEKETQSPQKPTAPVPQQKQTPQSTTPLTPTPILQKPVHISETGEVTDKKTSGSSVPKKENLLSDIETATPTDTSKPKPPQAGVSVGQLARGTKTGNLDALRARVTELSIGSDKKDQTKDTAPPALKTVPKAPVVSPMKPLKQPPPAQTTKPVGVPQTQSTPPESDVVFNEPKPEKKEQINESPEEAKRRAQQEVKEELAVQKDEQARKAVPKQIPTTKDSPVRPLRTYRDDLAQALQSKGTSYVGIVAAEERRRGERVEPKRKKGGRRLRIPLFAVVAISGLFVLAGIAILVYTFVIRGTDVTVIPPEEVPSFIFTERQQGIDVTDLNDRELMSLLTDKASSVSGALGSIEQFYFTRLVPLIGSGEIGEELVPARAFIEQLDTHAPGTLLRTINDEMTFGVHVFDGNEPFIILKTNFYENAFSGMLAWERYLNEDLSPLFGPVVMREVSTSTPFRNIPFVDRVIRNKEVRVLEDTGGSIVLLYSFTDRGTIVITTNEHTFTEIISRLTSIRI